MIKYIMDQYIMDDIFNSIRQKKDEKLEKKYEKEIKETCEGSRQELLKCLYQRVKEEECTLYIDKFQKCVNNFKVDFKELHNIKN